MAKVIIEGDSNVKKAADQFVNLHFGSYENLIQKIVQDVSKDVAVEGKLSRTEYDLFSYYVLTRVQEALTLAGLIMTKDE
jgi:hypothetical protein